MAEAGMLDEMGRHLKPRAVIARLEGLGRAGTSLTIALLFLALLVIGLLETRTSLDAPFIWDDLHLVRVYTPQELARAWTNTYDFDRIESYGFRPVTVYFEHLRALAFGEDVVAHRLFLVALFCIYLVLAGILARWLFATSFWPLLVSALLTFFHLTSVYHYIWITDGIYLLSGTLGLAAIVALLRALNTGRSRWLVLSLLCSALALLTREDSLTVYPLLLWFGFGFVRVRKDLRRPLIWRNPTLALYAVLLLIASVVYWQWRHVVAPQALPLTIEPGGLLWAAAQIVQNAGDLHDLIYRWYRYEILICSWQAWLGVLVVMGVLAVRRQTLNQVLFWSGAIVLAGLPNLVVARTDSQLQPVTFWSFLIVTVLAAFWNRSAAFRPRLFVTGMTLFALAAPAYGSLVWMKDQRVNSLTFISMAAQLEYAPTATIPEARRLLVAQELLAFGIASQSDFDRIYPGLVKEAEVNLRYGVNQRGKPFIPRLYFLGAFLPWPSAAEYSR